MTSLPSEVLRALQGKTLVTAESITGGGIGQALTSVPGASAVYKGGIVSYCDDVKASVLGVDEALLRSLGAVSAPVAEAMAKGVRQVCGASIGVGITGIAGPGSDGTEKPVGLVFLGYCDETCCISKKLLLNGSREEIRRESCRQAALLIKEHLNP